MIDTHLHILPGVDDGPETLQESLALAYGLVQEGIHTAIVTPHYNDEFPRRAAAEIRERVNELQQELYRHEIALTLFAGHEVLIQPGLVEDIQAGRIATLNGSRYLLLELWNSHWLPETERIIFELRTRGIVPIIAHPERYRAIQMDPDRLANLQRQGVLAQLTVGSLLGMQGNTTRRCAEKLLKRGLVQILASDAHGLSKRQIGALSGLQCAKNQIGPERVYRMVETIPLAIIKNEAIPINL
jgi:protein-tyrosine phosphatase